ncbi:hypothetical protein ACYOEI_12025 [Singulisphaera rosea]
MDLHEFSKNLSGLLYPSKYRSGASLYADPFTLLLRDVNWLALGRYALGVLSWEAVKDQPDLLLAARRATKRHFLTIPYFYQVGLYLVVAGPKAEWSAVASEIRADLTGFHAVIVQAVHFLDLDTGDDLVRRSKWGSRTFGGTISVTDAIDQARGARQQYRLRI